MNTSETNDEWTKRIVQALPVRPYYAENGIIIINSDCREILPHLPTVDLVLTDPPYGLGAARKNFGGNGVKRHMTGLVAGKAIPKRDYGDSAWDDMPVCQDLLDLLIAQSQHQIIFGGNYFDLGPAKCYLVWDKLRGDTDYADCELAWTSLNKAVRIIRYKWNGFLIEKPEDRTHPTQKPLEVMKWALNHAPADCMTILDPFMGSGTTLVAAQALGRKAIGIEISQAYCDIAIRRLQQQSLPLTEPLNGYKIEPREELYGAPTDRRDKEENFSS